MGWRNQTAATASKIGGLAFKTRETVTEGVGLALARVQSRSARDGALLSAVVDLAKEKASESAEDLTTTAKRVAAANMTVLNLATLARAGFQPTKVLGAPSTSRDAAILNVVLKKRELRRDVIAAASAAADSYHLSRQAIPRYKPLGLLPAPPKKKKEEKKPVEVEEENPDAIGLVMLTADVTARLAGALAGVVGPDLKVLTSRAATRLQAALAEPTHPYAPKLLDGLVLTPEAAFLPLSEQPPIFEKKNSLAWGGFRARAAAAAAAKSSTTAPVSR